MGTFTQSVQVELDATGTPRRLAWRGHMWNVCAEPLRWYEHRAWWEDAPRAQRGHGPGLVDHVIWRLQVTLGSPKHAEDLLTVHISHEPDTGRWRIINLPPVHAQQASGRNWRSATA